jgi:DNA-binding winged helix-turn-helix (wHTH) protein
LALFFGDWYLDVAGRRVVRGDDVRRLTPRLVTVLRVLAESGGRVVTKEELIQAVWNGRAVEEGNLNRAVSTLRGVLGDSPSRADLIETIPRVGYRFVPPVEQRPIGGTGVRVAPVGREAELTTLELLLDQAKGGRETVALVSGEAGMGKTALVSGEGERLMEPRDRPVVRLPPLCRDGEVHGVSQAPQLRDLP